MSHTVSGTFVIARDGKQYSVTIDLCEDHVLVSERAGKGGRRYRRGQAIPTDWYARQFLDKYVDCEYSLCPGGKD